MAGESHFIGTITIGCIVVFIEFYLLRRGEKFNVCLFLSTIVVVVVDIFTTHYFVQKICYKKGALKSNHTGVIFLFP